MFRVRYLYGFICISVLLLYSCGSLTKEEIEYKQSMVAGKAYYADECAKCHQKSGEGLGTLYPPLANSDYLKNHPDKLACIIYNGMKGPVTVNGKNYNWAMSGHVNMDDYELAVLITYIRSTWGNDKRRITIDQARAMIIECRSISRQSSVISK